MALNLNKNVHLPRYIVVVLDDDIIDFVGFNEPGISTLFGTCLQWIIEEFRTLVSDKKKALPKKAQRLSKPCIYFCLVPMHVNFGHATNEIRKKFNLCLESLCKNSQDIRVIKMKEIWDFNDRSLISTIGRITDYGLDKYWDAVEAAFKFNALRHELFLAKVKVNASISQNKKWVSNRANQEDKKMTQKGGEDPMKGFFRRHRDDSFHWSRQHPSSRGKPSSGRSNGRFLLPRLKF